MILSAARHVSSSGYSSGSSCGMDLGSCNPEQDQHCCLDHEQSKKPLGKTRVTCIPFSAHLSREGAESAGLACELVDWPTGVRQSVMLGGNWSFQSPQSRGVCGHLFIRALTVCSRSISKSPAAMISLRVMQVKEPLERYFPWICMHPVRTTTRWPWHAPKSNSRDS